MKFTTSILIVVLICSVGFSTPMAYFNVGTDVGRGLKYDLYSHISSVQYSVELLITSKGDIPGYTYDERFKTFCLELDERLDFSNATFDATIDDYASLGGINTNDNDPLDNKTRWIYKSFVESDVTAFDSIWESGDTEDYKVGVIQEAIWYIEEELGSAYVQLDPRTTSLVNLAATHINDTGLDVIKVLNLSKSGVPHAQSVLIITPEPATLAILALGGLLIRKRK